MKAAFYTLGCKVNQCETEYMTELLQKAGYEVVAPSQDADVYIVNSCTVTATADQKTRQHVRKFKRAHPNSVIVLTGCMPQAYADSTDKLPEADIVISNKSNAKLAAYLQAYFASCRRVVEIDRHQAGDPFAECSITSFSGRIRAFVKIEDGCNRFCSYCIIPMSRGRVRSKSPEDLQKEVTALAQNGIKEIVLVGINLSSYGKDQNDRFTIADAVKICADVPQIQRVRLGSLEPDHMTPEIIDKLAGIEKFCPQFHISLQSGCDKTLKAMNRHYTAKEYASLCSKLRAVFPACTLTTDVMTGFCGETDADFNASLEFVKKIRFHKVHVFPYSERPGTAASRLGDDVPKSVKESRANQMIEATEAIRLSLFEQLCGQSVFVLFEQFKDGVNSGYTRGYTPVHVPDTEDRTGQICTVKITSVLPGGICLGEILA